MSQVPSLGPTGDTEPSRLVEEQLARPSTLPRPLTSFIGREDDVAAALFISRRTAATHFRHIYDKLEVSSRTDAAGWAVCNGIA